MFCRNCGVKLADSDKFCSNCGSKVGTVGDSAAAFEAPIVKAPKVEAAPAVDVPKVEAAPAVVAQAQVNQVAASPAVCEQAGAEANVKYVPMEQKSSSKAITGFVLSLVGLLLFHLTCGIIGLIFSIKGMFLPGRKCSFLILFGIFVCYLSLQGIFIP